MGGAEGLSTGAVWDGVRVGHLNSGSSKERNTVVYELNEELNIRDPEAGRLARELAAMTDQDGYGCCGRFAAMKSSPALLNW